MSAGANVMGDQPARNKWPARAENVTTLLPVSAITWATRVRQEHGDIDDLAHDIAERGLLHPIVVRPDPEGNGYILVCGLRRLIAWMSLADDAAAGCIPATVVTTIHSAYDAIRVEIAENTARLDFAPDEKARVAIDLLPVAEAEARKRQGARTDQHPEKFSGSSFMTAKEEIAALLRWSVPTMMKAIEVVNASASEPEKYSDLEAGMHETGNVDRHYRQLESRRITEIDLPTPEYQPSPEVAPPGPRDTLPGEIMRSVRVMLDRLPSIEPQEETWTLASNGQEYRVSLRLAPTEEAN